MDKFLFIGNQKPRQFLEEALEAGKLGQSYCFSGVDKLGKRTLARFLASRILNISEDKLSTHPDFFFLERETDVKTGKLKKDISIDQTKDFKGFLTNRSWIGDKKVALVDEAELFNAASGNSLLKILEEPSAGSHIFLLTENDGFLLPTIRSRCQIIYFSLVAEEEIGAALKIMGCEAEKAEDIARAAFGRPGRALDLFFSEEQYNNYYEQRQVWDSLQSAPVHKRFKKMEKYFSEKSDLIKTKESLLPILELWMMFWRKRLRARVVENEAPIQWQIIDALWQAKSMLHRNVNPRLVIEQLLMSF